MTTNNTLELTEMRDGTRRGILDALTAYYKGDCPSYSDAFADTPGISRDTYYRYMREQPELIAEIDEEARALAAKSRGSVQLASDSMLLQESFAIQHQAADELHQAIAHIGRIARGEPSTLTLTNSKGKEYTKVSYPSHASAVNAFTALQNVARGGVLPEAIARMVATVPQDDAPDQGQQLLPMLGARTDFTEVTATTPDGTKFTSRIDRGDIVEGEVEE